MRRGSGPCSGVRLAPLLAGLLEHVIGTTGANVVSRVMGMVLATVAVDSILSGLDTFGAMRIETAAGV